MAWRASGIGLATLAAILIAAASAHAQVATQTIYHQEQLPVRNGQIVTVTVTCPPGYVATAGTTYPLPLDVKLLKSVSLGPRRVFAFEPAGYGATQVTLVVTCVKQVVIVLVPGAKPGKPKFKVKAPLKIRIASSPTTVRIAPGGIATPTTACPADSAPIGTNTEVRKPAAPRQGGVEPFNLDVRPLRSRAERGRIDHTLANAGTADAEVTVSVNCLPRTVKARRKRKRGRRSLQVVREAQTVDVGADGFVNRPCGAGRVPLTPIWDLTVDGTEIERFLLATHLAQQAAGFDFLVSPMARGRRAYLGGLCTAGSRSVKVE